MSQIKVNEIYDASGGSAAKLYGPSMRYGGTAFVNRIINGDMRIDQRNNGAAVTPSSSAYTLDRWVAGMTQASKYSVQQNAGAVNPPAGFTNYLGVTTVAAYSIASSDAFYIDQRIEGFNTADLGWGTAGAQGITLSFWVRSSLTGTFGGALRNSNNTRSYPFSYTVLSANTWEQKTISIAGDTTGTWLTNNGLGIDCVFGLGVGATYSSTSGAWAAGNFLSATGATSVVGTNGATFYITGVQLEAGSVASPFERRDYGRELMMCQRYFEKASVIYTSSINTNTYSYKANKRAVPTITNFPSAGSGGAYSALTDGDGTTTALQGSGHSGTSGGYVLISAEL